MHHLTLDRKIDCIEQVVDRVLNTQNIDDAVDKFIADFSSKECNLHGLRKELKRLVESGVRLGKREA